MFSTFKTGFLLITHNYHRGKKAISWLGHEIKPERLFAKYSTYEVKDLELPLQVTVWHLCWSWIKVCHTMFTSPVLLKWELACLAINNRFRFIIWLMHRWHFNGPHAQGYVGHPRCLACAIRPNNRSLLASLSLNERGWPRDCALRDIVRGELYYSVWLLINHVRKTPRVPMTISGNEVYCGVYIWDCRWYFTYWRWFKGVSSLHSGF